MGLNHPYATTTVSSSIRTGLTIGGSSGIRIDVNVTVTGAVTCGICTRLGVLSGETLVVSTTVLIPNGKYLSCIIVCITCICKHGNDSIDVVNDRCMYYTNCIYVVN